MTYLTLAPPPDLHAPWLCPDSQIRRLELNLYIFPPRCPGGWKDLMEVLDHATAKKKEGVAEFVSLIWEDIDGGAVSVMFATYSSRRESSILQRLGCCFSSQVLLYLIFGYIACDKEVHWRSIHLGIVLDKESGPYVNTRPMHLSSCDKNRIAGLLFKRTCMLIAWARNRKRWWSRRLLFESKWLSMWETKLMHFHLSSSTARTRCLAHLHLNIDSQVFGALFI
jgi:hypothetical protein